MRRAAWLAPLLLVLLPAGTRALSPPTCGSSSTTSTAIAASSATLSFGGQPTEAVAAPDGAHSFVAIDGAPGAGLGALGDTLGLRSQASVVVLGGEDRFAKPERTIPIVGQPGGLAVTPDGRLLLVADGAGVAALSAPAAASGSGQVVVGELVDGGLGADEVAVSPDSRYAFVAENGGLGVYDLTKVTTAGLLPHFAIGRVPLPFFARGVAVTPDGRFVLAVGQPVGKTQGQLAVVDALSAEAAPGSTAVHLTAAGCVPARVAVSPDGASAWVTATGSNALLGFDLGELTAGQSGALRASVPVGPAPVGVALADAGDIAVVAASDTPSGVLPGQHPALSIIDTHAALAGASALLGSVATGLLPQDVSVTPDGVSVLVADMGASQLQILDAGTLPEGGGTSTAGPTAGRMRIRVTPLHIRVRRRTRLHITVKAFGGPPLHGAAIRVGGSLAHTNAAGRATLVVRPRRIGPLRVVVSDIGFAATTETVTVERRR